MSHGLNYGHISDSRHFHLYHSFKMYNTFFKNVDFSLLPPIFVLFWVYSTFVMKYSTIKYTLNFVHTLRNFNGFIIRFITPILQNMTWRRRIWLHARHFNNLIVALIKYSFPDSLYSNFITCNFICMLLCFEYYSHAYCSIILFWLHE